MRAWTGLCLSLLGLCAAAAAQADGHYVGSFVGDAAVQTARDGPALEAVFRGPRQAVVDTQGVVYVADSANHLVRRIQGGVVSTLAGQAGRQGFADGPAASALFNEPSGVLLAADGAVLVLDSNNGRIRRISPQGQVSTVAGGAPNRVADGAGAAAGFNEPRGFAQDAAGNLYVADYQNQLIRKVTPAGVVSSFAGSAGQQGSVDGTGSAARFSDPQAIVVDAAGNLYVADTGPTKAIRKITPAGVVSTLASTARGARLSEPRGLALLADGSLLVADAAQHELLRLGTDGQLSSWAGSNGNPGSADGAAAQARFYAPMGLASAANGRVLLADSGNHLLREIDPAAATVATLAGRFGFSASVEGDRGAARFEDPFAVAVDAAGQLFVADASDHALRVITPDGRSRVLAGSPGRYGGVDGTAEQARFFKPMGLALGADGSLYLADSGNHRIRRVAADGRTTTVAGSGQRGHRDGAAASAQFSEPSGVAVAADGSVYVADFGSHVLRRIAPDGQVSTVAGSVGQGGFADGAPGVNRLRSPMDLAFDGSGNLVVLDRSNHAVRVLAPNGMLRTLAGSGSGGFADGQGSAARFQFPSGLAVDAAGIVYVADTDNQRLRRIDASGQVSSLAGAVFGRADGVGAAARFSNPKDVAVGADGRLWLVDRGNRSLRWAAPLSLGSTATECLLDWGERSYPALLAPPALSQTLAPYRYRAYAGGVYVGVSSGDRQVYLLQAGALRALGGLDGFLNQAACVAP